MDVGQAGRRVRAETLDWSSQTSRVLAAGDFSAQPAKVRAHR